MKVCPDCGFEGSQLRCPNDGATLLTNAQRLAQAPADPTQAPPAERTDIAHAPAAGGDSTLASDGPLDEHEGMRGENFGQWAEPEVKRKKEDTLIGRVISGRYEVQKIIGKGGMGAVYKARQPAVQRDVALKVLLEEFVQNETVVKRFYQEALAASRLSHPNTIKIYDFGQSEDGVLYIAMEFLRGHSLAQDLAAQKKVSAKRTVHIMRQVCKSLAEAHKSGIIHRDLKPDNIFLTDIQGERDYVKVLDFGVAKLKEYEGKEGTLTQAGMIFGTPKYMSPEQARSSNLDARSDVYALGVILYEMLAGRAPFIGDNPLSILIAHVNEQPKPFDTLKDPVQVHPALAAVIFKALSKHPDGRHPDVESLLGELEAVDELLGGADWAAVADRLPQLLPGAHGSPSLVGPAIVPQGNVRTAHGAIGGNTEVLSERADLSEDAGDATAFEIGDVSVLDRAEPAALPSPRKFGVLFALGLLLPLAGGATWLMTRNTDPPAVAVVDAGVTLASAPGTVSGGKRPVGTPATQAGSLAADAPIDAAVAKAPDPDAGVADAAVVMVTFTVVSEPRGARIINAETDARLGVTPSEVPVSVKTSIRLEKSGYQPKVAELDPASTGSRLVNLVLKAEAERPKPPRTTPSVAQDGPARTPATRAVFVPATPATRGNANPIELQ